MNGHDEVKNNMKLQEAKKCSQCPAIVTVAIRVTHYFGKQKMGSNVFCSPKCYDKYKKEE